jgi:hypothetical protein
MDTTNSNPEAAPSEKLSARNTGSIEAKEIDMRLGDVLATTPDSAENKRVLRRIDYW